MTRRKRSRTTQEDIEKEGKEPTSEQEKETMEDKKEKERETYPDPQAKEQELLEKTDEFLEKHAPSTKNGVEEDTASQNGKEEEKAEEEKRSDSKKTNPKNYHPRYFILIGIALTIIGFALGVLVSSLTKDGILGIKNLDFSEPEEVIQQVEEDLALHNIRAEDALYDFTFKVQNIDERVDGWYVTFEATNDSLDTVYFMANTIKLVDKKGKVLGPELGKGDIPQTFTGQGILPGSSDQATLVFKVPSSFHPDYFLLENITNMKNGAWTMKLDFDQD